MVAGQSWIVETEFATANNQGRHLVEDPTTGYLHLVFDYGEDNHSRTCA
jgi:hypothetical protein